MLPDGDIAYSNLHSTMYLLNQKDEKHICPLQLDLHSTMYLLNRIRLRASK